ncbi:MAG: carboxylesterase family protein [Prevotella sp.]|nr:carboxylesterase family protein [Prevotella sp.]
MKKLLFVICGLLGVVIVQAQPLLKTHVETGDVEGVLEGNDLACYYAIPFAAPPVGDLRWKAPQPAKPWTGVLKAKETAKWPPQPEKSYVKYDMMDEDCLYLSVVTPAKEVSEALPVMVFIHGGGFRTEHYGGELWQSLARRGVVTVSVAYRAGALGYLAHADLAKENPEGHSGNYGMLDLIFALQWVQRNIQNFGGDPAKVTIFGESAGAMSCHILCASPLAKGLFRACISESGAFMSPLSLIDQTTAQMLGYLFMNQLQKKSIAELRQMDAKSLTGNDVNFQGSTPIIDGYVMPAPLYDLYQKGEYYDVPVLIMYNSDEGAVEFDSVSEEMFNQQVSQLPGHWGDSLKVYYPGRTDEERLYSLRDLVRDLNFGWPAYAWATLQKQTGKSPVYMAYLAQKSDTTVYAKGNRRGAAHADDIMYLKGAFDNKADKYPQEKKVGDLMQQYWVNFAKTGGNPNGWSSESHQAGLDGRVVTDEGEANGKGLPAWPVFDEQKPTVMQFNNGASLVDVPNKERIALIDRFCQYIRDLRAGKATQ